MIENIIKIAQEASHKIMEIYNAADCSIEYKSDQSPITQADLVSNQYIIEQIQKISDLPIISEEKNVEYETRKKWNSFWLIDPLDGTKDFIAKDGQFTVNIALVENHHPILGVVSIPAQNTIYWGIKNKGAFKNNTPIQCNRSRTQLIGSDSNFHSTEATLNFYKTNHISDIKRYGSSLKFCKIAEGEIDVYARLNGTMEWDTAAAHIILNEAGGKIMDIKTQEELVYNKENLLNNYFIASRNDLTFIV